MVSVSTEGNTRQSQSPESREEERVVERPRRTFQREPWSPEQERRVSMEVVTNGSVIEATGGFVAVVLSILALASIAPAYLLPITTIALGIGLLFEGGTVALRYWRLPDEVVTGRWASMELAGGMITEFLAGIAGIVLGILALLGFAGGLLMTTAALVFGAALLLGSGLPVRLNYLETNQEKPETAHRFGRLMTRLAALAQVVFGAAGCVLAILGLVGIAPVILTTVAFLILGVAVLFSGSAVASRIMGLLHRC
jgi:hypothetical protein